MTKKILLVQSSGGGEGSNSRPLAALMADKLKAKYGDAEIIIRDVFDSLPPAVDGAWVAAAYAPEEARDDAGRAALAASDALVDEFLAADAVVIAAPMHNFTVSAPLKLWIDQVARAGRTFAYTDKGPAPLGPDRPTYVVITSGGTELGSPMDFASNYLRFVLSFNGLQNVEIIDGGQMLLQQDKRDQAAAQIGALAGAA